MFRIHITSWTASFRYPNLISVYQPTLPVPPFSTINGLISAAKGDYFIPQSKKIGYVFLYEGKDIDLETIYQIPHKKNKGINSNVIRREFLFETNLFLYTDSKDIAKWFSSPKFPLLLGRSSDLATVKSIKEINFQEKRDNLKLIGTIIPFKNGFYPGIVQALPKYFTNTLPRRNIGTEPYILLDYKNGVVENVKGDGIFDKEYKWDVFWQKN